MIRLLTLLYLLVPLWASAQLPGVPAPSGFEWEDAPEVEGAFLKPEGWFAHHEKRKNTYGIFISKQEIGPEGKTFTTGLTLNITQNIKKPMKFAERYRLNADKSHSLTESWEHSMGPFQSIGFVFDSDLEPKIRTHQLVIANPNGTVYVVIFEAPVAEWEEAWKLGEPMLAKLFINPEF